MDSRANVALTDDLETGIHAFSVRQMDSNSGYN